MPTTARLVGLGCSPVQIHEQIAGGKTVAIVKDVQANKELQRSRDNNTVTFFRRRLPLLGESEALNVSFGGHPRRFRVAPCARPNLLFVVRNS
jgi:hypothetical protein